VSCAKSGLTAPERVGAYVVTYVVKNGDGVET
jgi:hypothetical protein